MNRDVWITLDHAKALIAEGPCRLARQRNGIYRHQGVCPYCDLNRYVDEVELREDAS